MTTERRGYARRDFLTWSLACLASGLGGARAWGAGAEGEKQGAEWVTPKASAAIDRGLKYLAGRQDDDGSFGAGAYSRNVAVCGLAGLAVISSGSTPDRGPYGRQVEKCVDFILANTQESGFINVASANSYGPMYGHGFATLFLAECFGMTQRSGMREKLSSAVNLIVNTQNSEGGWRYHPQRHDADISVTIVEMMALRAARNAGFYVPKEVIDRGVNYVKQCQNPDGGFVYQLSVGGPSLFPRSAAGVVALYSAGIYEGSEITKGLNYLMQSIPRGNDPSREGHFYYGHYYAVQAMWQAGGKYWSRWYPAIRDALLARQAEDGSWPLDSDSVNAEYSTSLACVILQMPNNYLPIFQR